jgi:hypothetical protein
MCPTIDRLLHIYSKPHIQGGERNLVPIARACANYPTGKLGETLLGFASYPGSAKSQKALLPAPPPPLYAFSRCLDTRLSKAKKC